MMITDINNPECNVIELYKHFRVFLCSKFTRRGTIIFKPHFTTTSIAMWLKWLDDYEPVEILCTGDNKVIGTSEVTEESFKRAMALAAIWHGMGLLLSVKEDISHKHTWMYKFTPKWRTLVKRKGYLKLRKVP